MHRKQIFLTITLALIALALGWVLGDRYGLALFSPGSILSPLVEKTGTGLPNELPLTKYTITNLQQYPYQASKIVIASEIAADPDFTSYVFSYETIGKKMTGQINIPSSVSPAAGYPIILMMRGWAPEETYATGTGTSPAAAALAKNGYITVAPDFFGYGDSDPDSNDTWESRFYKPMNVIELLKTIEVQKSLEIDGQLLQFDTDRIGFWAHSNGGQITLTALEILERPIPTTLWAPVTAPFPYSLLFFTDEDYDEGKNFRKVMANFEEQYDVFEYSFTKQLTKLTGIIQIHQGTADDAVPLAWSQEFVDKVEKENERRTTILEERAKETTPSAETPEKILPLVAINLLVYPGMDHNMRPNWDTVMQRDLAFFAENL